MTDSEAILAILEILEEVPSHSIPVVLDAVEMLANSV